jgi:hypothetical protein
MNSSNSSFILIMLFVLGVNWSYGLYDKCPPPKTEPRLEDQVTVNGEQYLKSQNERGEWQVKKVNSRGYLE